MSDAGTPSAQPARRINWLVAALVVSLAVNLLVLGAGIARWYVGAGPERYARLTQSQIIPRFFFRDLDRDRRLELLAAFKSQDKAIREGRRAIKDQVTALADALEAEPYDPARTRAAVESFTARSEALFQTGSDAALAVIDQLTPDERRMMAMHLRAREDHGRDARKDDAAKPAGP